MCSDKLPPTSRPGDVIRARSRLLQQVDAKKPKKEEKPIPYVCVAKRMCGARFHCLCCVSGSNMFQSLMFFRIGRPELAAMLEEEKKRKTKSQRELELEHKQTIEGGKVTSSRFLLPAEIDECII
jgi:hypothetical protein